MRRLKVAHVITRLDLGGAQRNTLYTWTHLDPRRFQALLICGRGGLLDEEACAAAAVSGGPRLLWLPALVREVSPARDLLALLGLWNLFLAERPDVVHTHSSKAGVLGRLAARLAGVPVLVHTCHGFGFHEGQRAPLKSAAVSLERFCGGLSDALIFVSRANQETAKELGLGDPRRYRLIRSGVELSGLPAKLEARSRRKMELGLGRHKLVVASVGNLKPQKNPEDFLSMAERVAEACPEAEFLFVGDGPLRARLEARLLAKGLSGRVVLAGWRRDVAELLTLCDVFVLTSLWEGLPRALVEAMKSGLPPVCYAVDGVRDVVQDGVNGLLAPPRDAAKLSEGVLRLLGNEALRRRLGEAAAASIGPEFDIGEMVKAQERLYEELTAARPKTDA
ncbi:MAG: glycosyltransferase family 4 protein [Elusimicrobia bacterium]|nr:glycosyltransferase family 4 protein [Elusimicrobiota bacterium]MDE2424782.1 glycosyltransferase family 4 protein [Elusimicrobiota bacterium]